MDLTLMQGAVGCLKTAFDIAKGIGDLKQQIDVQLKVVELQQAILSAQAVALAAHSELQAAGDRIKQLEDELAHQADWHQEMLRYKLWSPSNGLMVFAVRQSTRMPGEQPHYLCATCFTNGKKAILSNVLRENGAGGWTDWKCGSCKNQWPTGYRGGVAAEFAPEESGPTA